MSNSHLKCKYCTDYFPREDMIKAPVGRFCSFGHVDLFIKEKQEKERLKKIQKAYGKKGKIKGKKKKHYDNDLKTRKEAAKTACHAFIRARDRGKPCISCKTPYSADFQACHFLESGNNPQIRYDEDNIHGGCIHCNMFKGGNLAEYRKGLIERIGIERVERLESMRGGSVKRAPQDYREVEDYYKSKIKLL